MSVHGRASSRSTCVFGAEIPPGSQLLLCLTYSCVTFQTHSKGIFLWESVSSLRPHADNRPLCVHALVQRDSGLEHLGCPGAAGEVKQPLSEYRGAGSEVGPPGREVWAVWCGHWLSGVSRLGTWHVCS